MSETALSAVKAVAMVVWCVVCWWIAPAVAEGKQCRVSVLHQRYCKRLKGAVLALVCWCIGYIFAWLDYAA